MRYGKINEAIWSDTKFNSVSDSARLMYIYLLSCSRCNSVGIFKIGMGMMEDDFCHTREQLKECLDELEKAALVCYRDGWVWFSKFLKWNEPQSPNHARRCASDLNNCIMKKAPVAAVCNFLGSAYGVLHNLKYKNTDDHTYYEDFKASLDVVLCDDFLGGSGRTIEVLKAKKCGLNEVPSKCFGSTSEVLTECFGSTETNNNYKYKDNYNTSTQQDNTRLVGTCKKEEPSEISLFCSDGLPTAVSQAAVRLAREGFPSGSEDSWAIALHHVYKKNLTDPSTRPDKTAVDDFFTASMASELSRTGGMA